MADRGRTKKDLLVVHTTPTYLDDVILTSPREALDALAYAMARIGRCIGSGGRRMERLLLREKSVLKTPDVQGRKTRRGSFKETIKVLRMIGEPYVGAEEGKNYTTPRKPVRGRIFHPHVKSVRQERRAAEKANRAALRSVSVTNAGRKLVWDPESGGEDPGTD